MKTVFVVLSNLHTKCCLKRELQKADQHTGGKWLIHGTIIVCIDRTFINLAWLTGGTDGHIDPYMLQWHTAISQLCSGINGAVE